MRRRRFIRWLCGAGCCTFHAAATTTGACADRAGARVRITACRSRYVRSTKPVARPAAHRAFMRICGLTGSIAADTAWPNADQRHTGQDRAQIQDHYRLRASVAGGRESPRPAVHRRRAQSALGVGHHLAENRRRLAVSGRGARVVFTGSGGLGDGEAHDAATDGRGLEDGAVAARQSRGTAAALRPRQSVGLARLSAAA